MIGFVLPLASAIENSVSLLDMQVWSLGALVVLVLALAGARLPIPGLVRHVEQGQLASGVFLGALAVALGLLNAACMTY